APRPTGTKGGPCVPPPYLEPAAPPPPAPDPADPEKREFAWMTIHKYTADRDVPYPFKDVKTLLPSRENPSPEPLCHVPHPLSHGRRLSRRRQNDHHRPPRPALSEPGTQGRHRDQRSAHGPR